MLCQEVPESIANVLRDMAVLPSGRAAGKGEQLMPCVALARVDAVKNREGYFLALQAMQLLQSLAAQVVLRIHDEQENELPSASVTALVNLDRAFQDSKCNVLAFTLADLDAAAKEANAVGMAFDTDAEACF